MATQRLKWLDATKGIAIVLVVLHHSTLWLGQVDLVHPFFEQLDYFLKQVRMPLFFLASGVATSFIHKRPANEYVAYKLLPIAWIYLVWTVIYGLVFDGVLTKPLLGSDGSVFYFVKAVVQPGHGLWFVFALGTMCLFALLCRGLPTALVLAITLAMTLYNDLGLAPHYFPIFPDWIVHNILNYCLLFFVGLYLSQRIMTAANVLRSVLLLIGVGFFGFVAFNLVAAQSEALFWLTQTARTVFGTALGLGVSILLGNPEKLGTALAWIGRRSLGIFLGHGLFLVPIVTLMPSPLQGSADFAMVMPVIVTGVSVAGATLLYIGLSRMRLGWVYVLPKSVSWRVVQRVIGRSKADASQTR